MKNAILFSIEEFAIHDGPGIRTTVFFKGCPLQCKWCHNPEGISPRPQYMVKKGEMSLCGYEITTEELARQILRNKAIYELNKGGVTFTGGEPLLQADFILELVDRLEGIHVAIETSGYAKEKVFGRIVKAVDLVLFDIKHTDPVMHKCNTGVNNKLILNNLAQLIDSGKPFIARIPLIPGVNDSSENMRHTAELLKDARSLQRVELMPYHQTAGAKYGMIAQEYEPGFDVKRKPQIQLEAFMEHKIKTIIL